MPNGERRRPCRRTCGFTYLGVLLLVALLGALLAGIGQRASLTSQRERERELLFRGTQIRDAIESYRAAAPPGQAPRWPASLQELLQDTRSGSPVHHLRRLYADPFTQRVDWVLLPPPGAAAPGSVGGVHSRATQRRLLQAEQAGASTQGTRVADWHFVAADTATPADETASSSTSSSTSPPTSASPHTPPR